MENLKRGLSNCDWTNILNDMNIHSAYKNLINIIQEQFRTHIPTVRVQKKASRQWTTPGIIKCEKKERKLNAKKCAKPTQTNIFLHKT